mmetsp:Transcript_23580/g.41796  ORF Transcript_23580/g.41796 Transcript_23580/m.41796 type:complete len:201 (+) Transcript_23580:1109-1711(+)
MESNFKLVLLGDSNVGKTSLLLKYVRNEFSEHQQCTLQANFLQKTVKVGAETFTLNIWDTVGQERYRSIAPVYYQNAKGALLTYDITDKVSLHNVEQWINELKRFADEDIVIFLVGNKADNEYQRMVSIKDASSFAARFNIDQFQVSAKTGAGLDNLFTRMAHELYKKLPASPLARAKSYKKIVLERAEDSISQPKKSCC